MKRALVTGASGDLGRAIAKQLAQDGFHVIVHAHRQLDKAQALAAELNQQGFAAQAVQFDIGDTQACAAQLTQLLAQGAIDVLINNAGKHDDAPLAGMEEDQWKSVIDVNLNGFYNVTQPLLLPMIRRRWGRIVSISSIAGVMGNRGQANYAAAKAGLVGASKSLALELASRHITVNVVAPGIIAGEMTQDLFSPDMIKARVPMQRMGTPQDIADAVSFLVSDKAAYITSQVIQVNGGMA
ncbi:MAG: 3-oxoacyl-ACP reductase FabG [Thiomicrospira sp.]|jgi:3-oxoacyl-[acyl-carrier protein] reductase